MSLLLLFWVAAAACLGAERSPARFESSPSAAASALPTSAFSGRYFQGRGDVEYLQLLDISRRLFEPDPEFQSLPMLYWPSYGDQLVNGLVEGPTWDAWWIQNSYGPTYCALPFLTDPCLTWLQNSQDQWFDQMGDGHRTGAGPPFNWVAPDGCLCDAARPGWIVYKQGDGRTDIHDWGMEFTAAGIVMQSELLLISRDRAALAHYLPKLERAANFIETRRDPTNNLFLAGPAGNLLAPSYAGWKKPDGSYGKAYLTGLSVNYIAALDRLIELEKLAGQNDKAAGYSQRRALARQGLKLLTTNEGYLIRSLDPDGVKHGVFGAPTHGYFETSPNQDAICFRVVDAPQARKIYDKLASIPGLRPHDVCIPNFPSYDDMYEKPEGLWEFGRWVNGGHWSTCEARLIMAYYQLGQFEDARRSMLHIMKFVRAFRMDNPLVDFGDQPYQPTPPINLVYDTFGIPAAMVRGLFEYLYTSEGVTILPHIPPGITELEQQFPIRLGTKRLYLATYGQGPISKVLVNGRNWKAHDTTSVSLLYDKTPDEAVVQIAFGNSPIKPFRPRKPDHSLPPSPSSLVEMPAGAVEAVASATNHHSKVSLELLAARVATLRRFHAHLVAAGLANTYEAAHALLAAEFFSVAQARFQMLRHGELPRLPERSQLAADQSYLDTTDKLCDGLEKLLASYRDSKDPGKSHLQRLYAESAANSP
jgi:hypothetical protein